MAPRVPQPVLPRRTGSLQRMMQASRPPPTAGAGPTRVARPGGIPASAEAPNRMPGSDAGAHQVAQNAAQPPPGGNLRRPNRAFTPPGTVSQSPGPAWQPASGGYGGAPGGAPISVYGQQHSSIGGPSPWAYQSATSGLVKTRTDMGRPELLPGTTPGTGTMASGAPKGTPTHTFTAPNAVGTSVDPNSGFGQRLTGAAAAARIGNNYQPGVYNQNHPGATGGVKVDPVPQDQEAIQSASNMLQWYQSLFQPGSRENPQTPGSGSSSGGQYGTSSSGLSAAPQQGQSQQPVQNQQAAAQTQQAESAASTSADSGSGVNPSVAPSAPGSTEPVPRHRQFEEGFYNNIWGQSYKNGRERGLTDEQIKALWEQGIYVAADGDYEKMDFGQRLGTGGTGWMDEGNAEDANWKAVGNVDDPGAAAGAIEAGGQATRDQEEADRKATEDESLQSFLDQLASMGNSPRVDEETINRLLQAQRQSTALQQSQTLRASMERGARAGASPEAMTGGTSQIAQGFATAQNEQEAKLRMSVELQNLNAAKEDAQRRYEQAVMIWQRANNVNDRERAFAEAQRALEEQRAFDRRTKELESQITAGDVFGALGGMATGIGGRAVGAWIGGS